MPSPTYIGEGGNMQSGGDVCGSVGNSVILSVITLLSPERLQLETSNRNFVCL